MLLKDFVNKKMASAEKVASAEGVPLTMNNCKKYKKMRDLKVYGNCFQDGTPSHENPIEVQCVGEKSRNLFREDLIPASTSDFATCDYEGNGVFHIYGNLSAPETERRYFLFAITKMSIPLTATNYTIYVKFVSGTPFYMTPYFYSTNGAETAQWANIGIYDTDTVGVIKAKTYSKAYNLSDANATERFYIFSYLEAGESATIDMRIQVWLVEGSNTDVPYEPYGKYKVPVIVRGKNLFGGVYGQHWKLNLAKGSKYTVSIDDTSASEITLLLYDSNKTRKQNVYMSVVINGRRSTTFTVEYDDIQYLMFAWGNQGNTSSLIDAQLATGEGEIEYEPYIEPITTNIYLDEPLRRLDNFADYIDGRNNNVVRKCCVRYLKNYNFSMRSTVYETDDGTHYSFHCRDATVVPHSGNMTGDWNQQVGKSNIFPIYARYEFEKIHFGLLMYAWGENIQITVPTEYLSEGSSAALKAWLTENNAYMVRVLAEPIEEPLDIELPKLNAKTTIIEVDTSLAPSNISGKYIIR